MLPGFHAMLYLMGHQTLEILEHFIDHGGLGKAFLVGSKKSMMRVPPPFL